MDWHQHAGLSERWQSLSRGHAALVKSRLAAHDRNAAPSAGDDRSALADAVLEVVRAANEAGELDELRRRFTPAYTPFAARSAVDGLAVHDVLILDDGRCVVVVDSPRGRSQAWLATAASVEPLLGVFAVGRSADRRVFALGRSDGVHLTDGWGSGAEVVLDWPARYAPIHPELPVPRPQGRPIIDRLLPFNDGHRVVVVSRSGVFLISPAGSVLVHPSPQDLGATLAEDGDDAFPLDLGSVHGAISSDQEHLVVGDQGSLHRVLKADGSVVAAVEPPLGHPGDAVFSQDGQRIALTSRTEDQGRTVILSVSNLSAPHHWQPGASGEVAALSSSMVGASAALPGGFVFGDSQGYVRLYDHVGQSTGELFVGGAVSTFDALPGGRQLAVGTDAGTVHLLDFDQRDAFSLGTVDHREVRRWIFWRSEPSALIW